MRIFCLSILISTFAICASAQTKVPRKYRKSVPDLSQFLTEGMEDQQQKVEAIHTWITHNIDYDVKKTESDKCFPFQGAKDVLKKKKALCSGYTRLMQEMLESVGVTSEVVAGYTYAHKNTFVPEIILDNHVWLAIRINGEWKLADPTWDAGYIGNLNAKKLEDKLEKKQQKIIAKNAKLFEAGKDTLPLLNIDSLYAATKVKGKQGFISEPTKDWFLVDKDKFTSRHLPLNPMWQLRPGIISVETFLKKDELLNALLKESHNKKGFDYEANINEYLDFNILEKSLFTADDAYYFNPKNPRSKAFYLFQYLSILNDKEVQAIFKDLEIEMEVEMYRDMLDKIDTTIHFVKESQSTEKVRFKEFKSFYKEINKESKKQNKDFLKHGNKGKKWNEKALKSCDKRLEKLPSQREKSRTEIAKTESKYPDVANYDFNDVRADLNLVPTELDSLNTLEAKLDTLIGFWKTRQENTVLLDAGYLLQRNNYLLKRRAMALEHKSINFNDLIDTIGVILNNNFEELDSIYNTELPVEMLEEDAFDQVKLADKLIKELKTTLKNMEEKDGIRGVWFVYDHFLARNNQLKEKFIELSTMAFEHNQFLSAQLANYDLLWDRSIAWSERQEELTENKNDYLVEQNEHDHNREVDLGKLMQENVKKWQLATKKRLKN